jgi:hypothetical protein
MATQRGPGFGAEGSAIPGEESAEIALTGWRERHLLLPCQLITSLGDPHGTRSRFVAPICHVSSARQPASQPTQRADAYEGPASADRRRIRAFGFLNPIILDDEGVVLAGHARLAAASSAGLQTVPTVRASGLTEAEKRAYVLADNRQAEKAGWDRELLSAELGELAVLLPQIDLDLTLTGFEPPEATLSSD